MPKYIIPVSFVMYGKYEIEADTLLKALDEVFANDDVTPLPAESEYLHGSLNLDEEDVIENNTLPGGKTILSDGDFEDLSEFINEREYTRQENS